MKVRRKNMKNVQLSLDEQEIKKHELNFVQEKFDVKNQVMKKINQERYKKKPVWYKKTAPIAVIGSLLLLTSITVYAGSQFMEIKDEKGKIVMKTQEEVKSKKQTEVWEAQDKIYDSSEIIKKLKPGEVAAVYINDEKANPEKLINFVHNEVNYKTYSDFLRELTEKEGPSLKQPSYLPEGYTFESGVVMAQTPNPSPSAHDKMYEKLQKEMSQEAEKSGEKLIVKNNINWSKSNRVSLTYSKGEENTYLYLDATLISDNVMPVVEYSRDRTTEKVKIGQHEGFYTYYPSPDNIKDHQRTWIGKQLTWIDKQRNIVYDVYPSENSKLTKEELIRIAESIK